MESYAFGGVADAKHADAFAGDEASLADGLLTICSAVVAGYHAEAGGTAVHGVELGDVWEF